MSVDIVKEIEQAEADQALLQEPVEVAKPVRRIYEGNSFWKPEIQPQPQFGEELREWIAGQKLNFTKLAAQVGCSAGTVSKWSQGYVPSPGMRPKLTAAGFPGEFFHLFWSQDMFIRSELVRIKNRKYVEGTDHPDREFYEKYLVAVRFPEVKAEGKGKARKIETVWGEREFLFSTRVSDVVGCVVGDEEALKDWLAFQALSEAIGEPVLVGIDPSDGATVEIRGSYREIDAAMKNLTNPTIKLEQNRARILDWSLYSRMELLQYHREAWRNRWAKRDEAGMFGTRAHKLGQAWIQFHALQIRDDQGIPQIDEIMAPYHFWDSRSSEETIVPVYLGEEPEPVQNALKALQYFWVSNRLTVVSTEELLASLEYGVAGAIDCLVRDRHGNLLIVDWKTSGGVYAKMFNQVTWYAILCHICRGEWPARAYIVRLDKLTAEVEVRCVYDNEETRKKRVLNALTVLDAYRGNEELESDLSSQVSAQLKEREKQQNGKP